MKNLWIVLKFELFNLNNYYFIECANEEFMLKLNDFDTRYNSLTNSLDSEERTLDTTFNRFDGSRLISPQMAEQWGRDLEEDYTPCQFVIRYAFTKGLVNEFDFVEWCRDELEGIKPEEEKYLIKDIYRNMVDLREIDVILTEGMAKLWDSWVSQEDFVNKAHENGIEWRITKYTPKQDKEMSTMNYQYLQTLDLKDENIEDICQETIN